MENKENFQTTEIDIDVVRKLTASTTRATDKRIRAEEHSTNPYKEHSIELR